MSSEYHKARKQLMLWAGILFIWELIGIDLEKAKDAGGNFGAIIGATKVDDFTVRLRTAFPDAMLLRRLFISSIYPRGLLERYGRMDAEEAMVEVVAGGFADGPIEGVLANYEVAVIERSRQNWEVVDGWAEALSRAAGDAGRTSDRSNGSDSGRGRSLACGR